MTDSTVTHNEGLWFPDEIWATIASFLDNDDLARFRLLCSTTQLVGSDALILQPLYNRLYAIDKTLPALLPQEGAPLAFKHAFEKIQARQQFEISYLTQHHPHIMAKPQYLQVLQESTTVSLRSLEAKSAVVDKINSEIIRARIDINSSSLNLNNACITRFSVTLFQEPAYTHFWQNLTHLSCSHNKLIALNVQGLAALQTLWCNNNQLTALDVQGLMALQKLDFNNNQLTTLNAQGLTALQILWCNNNQFTALNVQELTALQVLYCHNNQLTTLNVQELTALQRLDCNGNQLTTLNLQGLVALQWLNCDNNPLKTLILTGVHANTKNKYVELERSILFNKLSQTESPKARQAIIRRLGADYTYKNCLIYCPGYAAKLFAFDSANSTYSFVSSALSQACAFLPSFSFGMANNTPENTDLKRKREEDEIGLSEESGNQPDLKKRKRK